METGFGNIIARNFFYYFSKILFEFGGCISRLSVGAFLIMYQSPTNTFHEQLHHRPRFFTAMLHSKKEFALCRVMSVICCSLPPVCTPRHAVSAP